MRACRDHNICAATQVRRFQINGDHTVIYSHLYLSYSALIKRDHTDDDVQEDISQCINGDCNLINYNGLNSTRSPTT